MKKIMCFLFSLPLLLLLFAQDVSAAKYTKQNVTAYTAKSGSKTYHGTYPTKYRTAAVHPKTCGKPSSGTKLKYGTQIYTVNELYLPGFANGYKDDFLVEDMGDVNCSKGFSSYWFDIYFGVKGSSTDKNAKTFGLKKNVSYETY
ncbi:hypothetical protein [Bacillus atrophaeus]|uniref:hypothetical protein n=1 Tax=Bacillus atrophaeus TaxID=1452 RepID=UPI00227F1CFA|nr:hypothetical protein [Bacillus atrophaeus]MCY8466885.1 hypothetical protein [Bacillus atrophaeus]MCY8475774.1 hypothetical protein [Bacillus atrophaeus]MCY8837682.1 hypothetical protein [Bacillus atrophaeus]MCY8922062.1 hypothetical protein [Bacillus atrophaeus]MCY8958170.1 hypothetical protein [Bacillus atrophaeus]